MKKLFILIFLSIATLAHGQEMSVKSFHLAENDLTANTPGTMVYDQNGNVCALIKVETTLDGFSFDVGSLGVSEVKRVGGEIWVYVPYGIRRITLSHPQLGVIRDYLIPSAIERGRTYIMKLIAGTVRTIVEHAASKQFLLIELEPKDAILEINGKIKATDNGIYQELLPFGKWQYKVYCQNYHDVVGVVEISDPDNTHSLNLKLKPAFGHISVLATAQPEIVGAAVYIDEKHIGEVPLNNIQINSGSHRMRIIKELYEAYNETFSIADEENRELTPYLTPDFAEVTFTTISGADIFINGEQKGNQRWSGKLPCGSYILETRKKGHIDYKTTYEITRNDHSKTINIDGPTPIYGSLVISSTPAKAKVYIDSEYAGETPKYISKQVVGEYSVKVELNGYKTQTKSINITEGNEASLSFVLEKSSIQHPSYTDETQTKTINITEEQLQEAYEKELLAMLEKEVIPSHKHVDKEASFQGGDINAFYTWVNQHAAFYHANAYKRGVQGMVVVKFTVMKDGSVSDVKVIRGVAPELDNEAVRIVSQSPKWKPAVLKGRVVSRSYTLPIRFENIFYRVIYTTDATIKVGDRVTAKLSEGYVTKWEMIDFNKSKHVSISEDVIKAMKKGRVYLRGYVNGTPKVFSITIK